ncbi:MAG: hypothetical protein ACRYGR_08040 [Janthinobacterium lividum]
MSRNRGPMQGTPLDAMPEPRRVDDVGDDPRGPMRVADITQNIVTNDAERRIWDTVLGDIVRQSSNEVDLRQSVFQAVRASKLEHVAGREILRRAVRHWRGRL